MARKRATRLLGNTENRPLCFPVFLRYGNYVLTGDDILNQSWKIGDAPELVYGVVVDYGE